jgi:hypothetical protein
MPEAQITLHDLLLHDWGVDLPICGGSGTSRDDPITITAADPETVARTQILTLRGICRGRGVFWRTIGRIPLSNELEGLEQFRIETVQLTETEIIPQTENHYFDVSAAIAVHGSAHAAVVIAHRDRCGLVFPYEIGWMHFEHASDDEAQEPGAGASLRYYAPGVTGSLFVYDRNQPDIPDDINDDVVREEFKRSTEEVASANPSYLSWPDQPRRDDCLERFYRDGDEGIEGSLLSLTTARGRFVKCRVTWHRDTFIDRAVLAFVDSVVENARNARSGTGSLH